MSTATVDSSFAPAPRVETRPTRYRAGSSGRLAVIYGLIFVISLADALTPAGVVIGIFLGIPIVLASLFAERRHVVAAGIASLLCFVLAAELGAGPIAPQAIWLPNRIFALLSIVAFTWIAAELQRHRQALERARAQAESARDLARLMHSLMAHDLRAPLVLARQGFDMVRSAAQGDWPPNLALIEEVDGRITRSLGTIALVLDAARSEFGEAHGGDAVAPLAIRAELEEEVSAVRAQAERRGKTVELIAPADLVVRVNGPVLFQCVSILLDNALRYAVPGRITVLAEVHGAFLWVHVRDQGPGLDAAASGQGSGIGLRLSRLLAERAGGTLELARSGVDGTEFILRLPAGAR